MKNNRLNNDEILELKSQVETLRELASMDKFGTINAEKTEMLKREMRPYMMWFEVVADKIEKVLKER